MSVTLGQELLVEFTPPSTTQVVVPMTGPAGGTGGVLVVDNGDGTVTLTVDPDGPWTLVDNGDGTADLTLEGQTVTLAGTGGGSGWTAVDASETVKGIAELATQAETDAGTDDTRIVTPLKLQTRLAAQTLDTITDSATRLAMTAAERTKLGVTIYTTALANGSDQSTTLQAEADALAALGGGRLMLPAGVVVGHVSADAGVVVEGRGKDATFLKRPAAWDGPVVQSTGYTTMVNTSGTGTTHDMGCRNLTIDGNRAAGGFTVPLAGTAPSTPTTSTSTTGGTIAAGTQWYRIAPITAAGVGVVSAPINQVTTGSTSTVTVNWSAVTGATGYVIYGRSFNGTRITAVGAVTTWTDTGALTPLTAVNFKRSGNLTAYPAVGLYGWRPVLQDVRVIGAPGPGVHVNWYTASGAPATGATMEATLRDIHIEDCGTNSLIWEGPHDSVIHNLFAARPGQAPTVTTATTSNVVVEGGGPVRFVTSHAWGQALWGFELYGQTDLTACQAEGALTGQVLCASSGIQINGLEVFFPGGASAKGLVFGSSSLTVTNVSAYNVHASGFSSSTGTAIDITHAGTGNSLTGIIDQTTGTPITGSTPADMYVNMRVNGMAGGRFQVPNFPSASAGLVAANNLSDVVSAATARTNLGLGTAATHATGDYDASGAASTAQAYAIQRANHTGTQTASTISDLAAATNPLPGEAAPADFGFTHWTFNPILLSGSGNMAAGNGFFTKVFVRQAATISTIYVYVGAAGTSLTNVGFALYDASSTLLTSTVNANGATAAAFQSVGLKPVTITPQAVTGPVYVLFWFTGTTTPGLIRQAPTSALLSQLGLSSPNLTVGTAGTGLTTSAPSPMGAQTAATFAPWVALA